MPWVRFTANFDYRPRPAVTVAYLAGQLRLVTSTCAARAVAAGKAHKTAKPKDGTHA